MGLYKEMGGYSDESKVLTKASCDLNVQQESSSDGAGIEVSA